MPSCPVRLVPTLMLSVSLAACGSTPGRGAMEPALAESARPLSLEAPLTGELAPPCERLVFSFRPAERGEYEFEARSEVPVAVRLFEMSPDLYVATGRREGEASRVASELVPETEYAVTVTPGECRAASYSVAIARR